MEKETLRRSMMLGDFRRLVVSQAKRLLIEVRQAAELKSGGFVGRDETLVIRRITLAQAKADVDAVAVDLAKRFPDLSPTIEQVRLTLNATASAADSSKALAAYRDLIRLFGVEDVESSDDSFDLAAIGDEIVVSVGSVPDEKGCLSLSALESYFADQRMLRAVCNRIVANRRLKRSASGDDLAAISAAYRLLDRGVTLPPDYQSIGTYGFREHQTMLSLADPGDGHLSITCADDRLLQGVIVHVEHIDREGVEDREAVEAYRLPAAINAARVRLHVGSAAPCSAYVGRPLLENGVSMRLRRQGPVYMPVTFPHDLLKTAHATASACTAMFMNGIAECKIAMERLSLTEMLVFMTALAGNTMRDPARQYFSAAFNLNLPIWDDRNPLPRLIESPFEIANTAIDIAVAGQFEKVTWDSASNKVPSDSILKQLSHSEWVTLVHRAHELGLETYVSAGLKAPDMRACVNIGVDGVGIGTSMHYTESGKAMGQLKPNAILDALNVRDTAAAEVFGQAARLLARLDRMYFEKILPTAVEPDRIRLFEAVRDADQGAAANLLARVELGEEFAWSAAPDSHPVLAQATRVLASSGQVPIGVHVMGAERWAQHLETIAAQLRTGDVSGLRETMR